MVRARSLGFAALVFVALGFLLGLVAPWARDAIVDWQVERYMAQLDMDRVKSLVIEDLMPDQAPRTVITADGERAASAASADDLGRRLTALELRVRYLEDR